MGRLSLLGIALLAACSDEARVQSNGAASEMARQSPLAVPSAGQPAGRSGDRTPMQESAIGSPQAAAQVLERYFALAEAGEHAAAAKLWWDGAQARAFTARLDRYGTFEPNIAAPRISGAAGSLYAEVSLQLLRNAPSGQESLSDGTAVLRRVNDVPGSTAEQRQWRIHQITLQPPPAPLAAAYPFVGRWATEARNCGSLAWRFTAESLSTPAGSHCSFRKIAEVPGGYDIAARCTSEGPPVDDLLKLRFAQSAKAMLFESRSIADAGLERC